MKTSTLKLNKFLNVRKIKIDKNLKIKKKIIWNENG